MTYGTTKLGEDEIWLECSGAVKVVVTVVNSDAARPGANPSVEVAIIGSDDYVYYE